MEALANELRQAIQHRARVLDERLAHLRGTVPGEGLAISGVLDLFRFFPRALLAVVEAEWNRNSSAESRVQILRPLLRHTTDVATFVEEWLGHTGATSVPLYVLDSVRRVCVELGVGDRPAVVAAGPADNFTTGVGDIRDAVFGILGPLCPDIPAELKTNAVLIRAPRLEGAVALWHPILLGHELAHLGIEAHSGLAAFDLPSSFDLSTAATLPAPDGGTPGPASALRLLQIGTSWATELMCDAFAVRTFGAGAVAALGEFLETISATDLLSDTHPPGRLRIELVIDWLGAIGNSRIDQIVEPWRELAGEPSSYDEAWADFLVETLRARSADIWDVIAGWPGPTYDVGTRADVVLGFAEQLRLGMPPEALADATGLPLWTTEPDIVTAAWVARAEDYETPVDRLAEKALANAEFLRQWIEAEGEIHTPPSAEVGKANDEHPTLSDSELLLRLDASGEDRLVVTPRLANSVAGASVDLRLGNNFIVFVRSRTQSFDPLDERQDPRQVQRGMQLGWGDTFVLHPSELVLAATLEYLVLPADLTAQVITRSSYGRLGLLSATAVQVHPHFHGCLTLELVNLGTVPLLLTPGERIAQLVVSVTAPVPPPPSSKYHCPIGPEFSKVRTDAEAAVLRRLRRPAKR